MLVEAQFEKSEREIGILHSGMISPLSIKGGDMNNNVEWLTRFLFFQTRQTLPDGRPLYAYKCGDKKYAELKELTKGLITLDLKGRQAPRIAPIFCLYAAEAFCREHSEGSWTWETVFDPLGMAPVPHQKISDWVQKGLDWWRRSLIRGQHGDRRFLVTIACEGGLPLRLLQNENAKLTQFFRTVLDAYHSHGCSGAEAAEAIARQHEGCLPITLRQEVVFHLSGELIAQIVELQRAIGNAPDPIAALDQQSEDWRRRLPLYLEDKTTEALLNGLLVRSQELTLAKATRLRWRGRLHETATGFRIEKGLELPERLSGRQILAWIDQSQSLSLKPRLRLMLHTRSGTEAVAWLTLIQGTGEDAVYRREWLRRGGLVLSGEAVLQPHGITLHDGQTEYPLTAQNGDPWEDLPWVFIERGTSKGLEWLTEGSARTRSDCAWIMAADSLTPTSADGKSHEKRGRIADLGRTVYRVSGQVDFITPEHDCYRIVCGAEDDSDETYALVGDTLPEALGQRTLYKGLPRILCIDSQGKRRFPSGRIQWRPVHAGGAWRDSDANAVGKVWIRLVDSDNDIEQFRQQVDVLPHAFRLERNIGSGNSPGIYRLSAIDKTQIEAGPGVPIRITVTDDEGCIECPFWPGTPLPLINLSLRWSGSSAVQLTLPYPQRGALYQLAGRPLQRDDLVPLDRIGGLQLIIQDPAGRSRYWLDGQLIANDELTGESRARLGFRDHLPPLVEGRLELPLFAWHDRIAHLLASSRDLEARLRLEVCATTGETLGRIHIARFDAIIQPNRSANKAFITDDSLARLGPNWNTRVRLEMIPLWEPGKEPVLLSPCADQPASWDVPKDLESGPWWVIGRDGDWARFRPLLWNIARDDDPSDVFESDSILADATREPNPEQRESRLTALLSELSQNPSHPDWPRLFDYVRLTREFPPSSLDVLRLLVSHPRTLALALLKADDEIFDRVWSFSEYMPFSWSLIPVEGWRGAAETYFEHVRISLGELDPKGEIAFEVFKKFRERTVARRQYWRPLSDWLQERLFPDRPLQDSELQFARRPGAATFMDLRIQQAEQELLGRHDADEIWPQSDEVMDMLRLDPTLDRYAHLHPIYRPVRCAPFITAYSSLKGISPSENLIYELRLLRAFDPEWFDTVYAIALTLGLALPTSETDS